MSTGWAGRGSRGGAARRIGRPSGPMALLACRRTRRRISSSACGRPPGRQTRLSGIREPGPLAVVPHHVGSSGLPEIVLEILPDTQRPFRGYRERRAVQGPVGGLGARFSFGAAPRAGQAGESGQDRGSVLARSWPGPDAFRILPERVEVLDGMLVADSLVFQPADYARCSPSAPAIL